MNAAAIKIAPQSVCLSKTRLLWSAEVPDSLPRRGYAEDSAGATIEAEAYDTGFRKVEIQQGLLKLNGKPLLIRGTNRHEHHPEYGQVMDVETMRQRYSADEAA